MENEPTPDDVLRNQYRFSAFKYSLRAPSDYGPNDIIPQDRGFFTFPKGDEAKDPAVDIYDNDNIV